LMYVKDFPSRISLLSDFFIQSSIITSPMTSKPVNTAQLKFY
jgi:hypothetical protein